MSSIPTWLYTTFLEIWYLSCPHETFTPGHTPFPASFHPYFIKETIPCVYKVCTNRHILYRKKQHPTDTSRNLCLSVLHFCWQLMWFDFKLGRFVADDPKMSPTPNNYNLLVLCTTVTLSLKTHHSVSSPDSGFCTTFPLGKEESCLSDVGLNHLVRNHLIGEAAVLLCDFQPPHASIVQFELISLPRQWNFTLEVPSSCT